MSQLLFFLLVFVMFWAAEKSRGLGMHFSFSKTTDEKPPSDARETKKVGVFVLVVPSLIRERNHKAPVR